jgi:hypothetical protein
VRDIKAPDIDAGFGKRGKRCALAHAHFDHAFDVFGCERVQQHLQPEIIGGIGAGNVVQTFSLILPLITRGHGIVVLAHDGVIHKFPIVTDFGAGGAGPRFLGTELEAESFNTEDTGVHGVTRFVRYFAVKGAKEALLPK